MSVLLTLSLISNCEDLKMSPKFYGYLWAIFFAAAAIIGISGLFTMQTLVVFGFCAFGLVFLGMMCVLPGVVSHSHEAKPVAAASSKMKVARKPSGAVAGLRSA